MLPIGPNARNRWTADAERVSLVRPRAVGPVVALPARHQDVELDLGRTAIVVIDMQNDFCSPAGWLAHIGVDVSGAARPIAGLLALLPSLRRSEVPVVWLNWGNRLDRANLPPNVLHVYDPDGASSGIGALLPGSGHAVLEAGSWGSAVVDALQPCTGPDDVWVDKYRMSGFWDTCLDSVLRNLDVTTLLFGGVNVDQCVFATLIDAACAGYDCVLLDDCSGTTSPDYCAEATRYNVAQCFGFVAEGADLVAALEALER